MSAVRGTTALTPGATPDSLPLGHALCLASSQLVCPQDYLEDQEISHVGGLPVLLEIHLG